ncbi:MAG: tetratricopeptide repeat protein [Planctomycetes bacterium]|nr:tetratricopeptide repeat protein [Planctomycetota bacterium]
MSFSAKPRLILDFVFSVSPPATRPKRATESRFRTSISVSQQRRAIKKTGEEKKAILEEAIAAYSKVKEWFPQDHKRSATASLRMGNLHRSLREADKAIASYKEAMQFPEEAHIAASALEQIGLVQRRMNRIDDAIASLRSVAEQYSSESAVAARALVTGAKCQIQKKDVAGARQTLRQAIEKFPEEETAVINAFDLLATTFINEKKITEAEGVIRECREMFKEEMDGDGKDDDESVKRHVDRMRAPKLIAREKAHAPVPSATASTHGAGTDDDDD